MADDFVRLRLSNKGIKIENLNGSISQDIAKMGVFDRDINAIERRIMSVLGEENFRFNRSLRQSTPSGYQYQDVIVPKNYYSKIIDVLKAWEDSKKATLGTQGKDPQGKNIYNTYLAEAQAQDVRFVEIAKSLKGSKAKTAFMREAMQAGGYAVEAFTNKNRDRMKAYIPVLESEYLAMEQAFASGTGSKPSTELYNRFFPSAKREHSLEAYTQKQKAKEVQAKELARQEKEAKVQAKEAKRESRKEEKRKAEEEAKKKKASSRKLMHLKIMLLKIISVIALVADITRRILTSVLSYASEARKSAIMATSLGMSGIDYKRNTFVGVAKGLGKGTINQAISDIQGKFGDVTNLDEQSLGVLARVMGTDVSDLVRSGMGGKTPDVLMEKIIDRFFAQFKSGKNSLGQEVGQEQALRELSTVLAKISPALASVFQTMAFEWLKNPYASAETLKDWENEVPKRLGGTGTEAFQGYLDTLGGSVNELKSNFEQLTTQVKSKLLVAIGDVVNWINNSTIGQSSEEKIETNAQRKERAIKAYELNKRRARSASSTIIDILSGAGADYSEKDIENIMKADPARLLDTLSNKYIDNPEISALINEARYGTSSRGRLFAKALGELGFYHKYENEIRKSAGSVTGSMYKPEWMDSSSYAYIASEEANKLLQDFQKSHKVWLGGARKNEGLYTLDTTSAIDFATSTAKRHKTYEDLTSEQKTQFSLMGSEFLRYNAGIVNLIKGAPIDSSYLKELKSLTGKEKKEDLINYFTQIDADEVNSIVGKAIFNLLQRNDKKFTKSFVEKFSNASTEQLQTFIQGNLKAEEEIRSKMAENKNITSAKFSTSYRAGENKATVNVHFFDKQGKKMRGTELTFDFNSATGFTTQEETIYQDMEG